MDDSIEEKAKSIGWLPKEQFRGDPDKWVPAEKYIEKGENFIPFLQADKRRLEGALSATNQKVSALESSLREATETIEALKEFRTELNKERVEEAREQLVGGIKAAREAGDVEGEERLREKLAETRQALKETTKVTETKPIEKGPDPMESPEWKDFVANNPWWSEDPVMRAASVALGQDLAAKGKLDGLSPTARFAAIAQATKERFGQTEERRDSKVEGTRGGGTQRQEKGQGFMDLPADVKDGCARFEARLVGPKKAYKTVEEYRKSYAAEYFKRNPNG